MMKIGDDLAYLARTSDAAGHPATARKLYHEACQAYKTAQHAIMADIPQKRRIWEDLNSCYDRIIDLSPYPIERVEIPWEGKSFPALFHSAAGSQSAPTVLFIPGMDATKEDVPNPNDNIFLNRGLNVLVMDGPGQGESNVRGLRVDDSNYERAATAAIDWLVGRPEVDRTRIGLIGLSMGSFWAARTAAHDSRVRALVSAMGVFGDKRWIFDLDSPHFKQQFMYMAGVESESDFDAMASKMTLHGHAARIKCPTLVCCGEFDPLCPLEDTYEFYDEIGGPAHLWVIGEEAHRLHWVRALGGLSIWHWCLDWLSDALNGKHDVGRREIYVGQGGGGPFATDAPVPAYRTWRNGAGI